MAVSPTVIFARGRQIPNSYSCSDMIDSCRCCRCGVHCGFYNKYGKSLGAIMKSMEAYIKDLKQQYVEIGDFTAPSPLSDTQMADAVFTGSGDSLAAAMLAESLSNYTTKAVDPLEILYNPRIVQDKRLYIISVSGRTITNIRLAQRYASNQVVAITANAGSELALLADDIIELKFPSSDILTAGSISFLNSALVCMSLVCPIILDGAVNIMKRAKKDAGTVRQRGRTFFVGNQYTFPVAMYAAAKSYEIRGRYANYSRAEQFAHMELFSVKSSDTVILFDELNSRTRSLAESLESEGVQCIVTNPNLSGHVETILYHILYAQHIPLNDMEQDEAYFMREHTLRGISDEAIY